jgi:thiosulfate/3-mercaptopyruvate sulfurtransferase
VIEPIVSVEWLRDHLGDVVVADVRSYLDGRSGWDAYTRGHVPGAVFVDRDRTLAAPPSPQAGRHPLSAPDVFAAGMAALGVGDDDTVVAYDDAGGAMAARLVWMLRATGHQAALLDGGLAAWEGELSTDVPARTPAVFTAGTVPPDQLADADEVAAAIRERRATVIDARSPERYRGEVEPIDAVAGHVPGAVNVPFEGNLDPATGRFRSTGELRERFEAAGVEPGADTIVYCGSGVTACHDLLALEAAGLGPGRLYTGSWSQWSADPERPIATGADP